MDLQVHSADRYSGDDALPLGPQRTAARPMTRHGFRPGEADVAKERLEQLTRSALHIGSLLAYAQGLNCFPLLRHNIIMVSASLT